MIDGNIFYRDMFGGLVLEHEEWCLRTFTKSTTQSSINKAKGEIEEIQENIDNGVSDPLEYVDAIMCLFDAARREGISYQQIFQGFKNKLEVNKAREWKENPDGSYSHIKLTPIEE